MSFSHESPDGHGNISPEMVDQELQRLTRSAYERDGQLCIPGMEGFFSRLLGTVFNAVTLEVNLLTGLCRGLRTIFRHDWENYCYGYLKRLKNDPPSQEIFSSGPGRYATYTEAMQHTACLKAVVDLIQHMDTVVLSQERDRLPRKMQQVISYLENNHCNVEVTRPSKCSTATRFTYSRFGKLINAGYGRNVTSFITSMEAALNQRVALYRQLTATTAMGAAQSKLEQHIRTLESSEATLTDSQRQRTVEHIANIRYRLVAMRAIYTTASQLYRVTLITDFILPCEILGRWTGMQDGLISWILAESDE